MPASRKKSRTPRSINYGLLTDDTKKLQYFKSHLPTRVNAIKVRDKDVKPGDSVIMDITGDDSGTSTSDDVCIAEVLEIRSSEYGRSEQFVLIRWYYSGSMLQNLQHPTKAIKNFSSFRFAPRELVSSDHMHDQRTRREFTIESQGAGLCSGCSDACGNYMHGWTER
ncbi:hypothetical protein RSAG8_01118, partial [Rhizoctonia solani AG-8 WAC10335]